MKTTLLFIFVLLSALLSGQNPSLITGERVQLITDRSLYVSGENIRFVAALIQGGEVSESRVLYAELITPDGSRVYGAKFPITNGIAEGSLPIPPELISGTYYCRAYTRVMRNEGPGVYAYTSLKVVNPIRREVQPGSLQGEILMADSMITDENAFEVRLDRRSYSPGDTLHFSAKQRNDGGYTLLAVSVLPENTELSHFTPQPEVSGQDHSAYYPDTRGISISGKVVDPGSKKVLVGVRVYLSILGSQKDFMAIRTDSMGVFNFSLPPFTGNQDLFICSENRQGNPLLIYIDNDFCTRELSLPSPVFSLNEKEAAAALKLAVNLQLQNLFAGDTLVEKPFLESAPFYGRPEDVIFLDQFVQLPEMEEYFNELPTKVKVRKRDGHPYFKLTGTGSGLDVYEPLVLVDWVAVDDPERVLAINPRQVERIELIMQPYVKGEETFGGIISILSKKGDFAGMDLPSSGLFLNYRFFEKPSTIEKISIDNNLPDARNTLYFKGVKGNEAINGSIILPKESGVFDLILKGLGKDGKKSFEKRKLVVR